MTDLTFSNLQTRITVQISESSEVWSIQQANVPESTLVPVSREIGILELQAAIDRYEVPQEVITDLPDGIFAALRLLRDPAIYVKRHATPMWSPIRLSANKANPSPFLSERHGNC